jgi:plasmid maintenance system antidote protein VapI
MIIEAIKLGSPKINSLFSSKRSITFVTKINIKENLETSKDLFKSLVFKTPLLDLIR